MNTDPSLGTCCTCRQLQGSGYIYEPDARDTAHSSEGESRKELFTATTAAAAMDSTERFVTLMVIVIRAANVIKNRKRTREDVEELLDCSDFKRLKTTNDADNLLTDLMAVQSLVLCKRAKIQRKEKDREDSIGDTSDDEEEDKDKEEKKDEDEEEDKDEEEEEDKDEEEKKDEEEEEEEDGDEVEEKEDEDGEEGYSTDKQEEEPARNNIDVLVAAAERVALEDIEAEAEEAAAAAVEEAGERAAAEEEVWEAPPAAAEEEIKYSPIDAEVWMTDDGDMEVIGGHYNQKDMWREDDEEMDIDTLFSP